ncbi:hypothetical protein [Jiella marina]|uniref:hypothetical protein n=1 Tax=Jiella sp. LLJ827 TaxID=2917712 RepID=UPI002100687B|nr:hypothetical protein [Jiella sp. LLJ827]MCQ0986499.1 hypothetical protein [Jiella sp. LLJ827]
MMVFEVDWSREKIWPEHLKPIGEDTLLEKESFAEWWSRHHDELDHLPAIVCEQWIHRHWLNSPWSFLPLDSLQWERTTESGEYILQTIYSPWDRHTCPQFDYETFQQTGGEDRLPTAKALDSGTWDYPVVAIRTPHGIKEMGKNHLGVRRMVVEGHQRLRYLRALHMLGQPPVGPHEVITLSSPLLR